MFRVIFVAAVSLSLAACGEEEQSRSGLRLESAPAADPGAAAPAESAALVAAPPSAPSELPAAAPLPTGSPGVAVVARPELNPELAEVRDFALRAGTSTASAGPTNLDVPAPTNCEAAMKALGAGPGWLRAESGIWEGTGHTDPEPLKEVGDSEILSRAFTSEDTWERTTALVSAARRKLPQALEAIRKGLEHSEDKMIRMIALSALIEHGGSEALEIMWKVLREDPNPDIRGTAVGAIAVYGEDQAFAAITEALKVEGDENQSVRQQATLVMWALRDRPELAMPLLELALNDPHSFVWQEAINVLGRWPSQAAGTILRQQAMGQKKDELRQQAAASFRLWRERYAGLCD